MSLTFGADAMHFVTRYEPRKATQKWAALDWTIGEMGPLQYWITPEDLAARRLEKTVLTIEAY